MSERQEEIWDMVVEIHAVLPQFKKVHDTMFVGNGEDSVKVQLATIKQDIGTIKEGMDAPCLVGSKNKNDIVWLRVVIGALATAFISVIGWLHK